MYLSSSGVISPAAASVLDDHLGRVHPGRRFVEAVIEHLTGPTVGRSEEPVTAELVRIFAEIEDRAAVSMRLERDPDLLASFFQNADLLDPARPESKQLSLAVMAAIHRIDVRNRGTEE